ADHVILEGLDRKGLLVFERLEPALRHGEGVVTEIDLLLVLVPLVEREIDDPGQLEAVTVDEVELLAGARARRAREGYEFLGVTGHKEAGIAVAQAKLSADRLRAFRTDILGDRTGTFERTALVAPENIAEARLPLTLRPGVHAVAESARASG